MAGLGPKLTVSNNIFLSFDDSKKFLDYGEKKLITKGTRPIEENCACPTCARFSRAYLRHLFATGEILGMRLCTLHNLHYFQRLMAEIRFAIEKKQIDSFLRVFFENTDLEA